MAEEKKLAYRRVVKNADGKIRLMYVDANTGQPLNSLEGYTLLDQGVDPITVDPGKETKAKEVVKPLKRIREGATNDLPSRGYNFAGSRPRGPSNNYGYIDKGFALKAIGALGLPGKAVSLAVNANNVEAVNSARQTMGLEPLGPKETISSLAFDRGGYVGDVKIGDQQYSVGLKALDRAGRTTLTPTEARQRSLRTGTPLQEASPQEREQSIADAKVNPDIREARGGLAGDIGRAVKEGVTGGLSGAAASVLSNVSFGGPRGTYEEPVSRQVAEPTAPSPAMGAAAARGLQGYGTPTPTPAPRNISGGLEMGTVPTPSPRTQPPVPSFATQSKRPYSEQEISQMTEADPMGFRAPISSVDWDRTNLANAAKARMKEYTNVATARGLNPMVDMKNMTRTPQEQAELLETGATRTMNSYHISGMAVDVSPLDDTNQEEWSEIRQVGEDLGFGQLGSWDPAHLQLSGYGMTAAELASLPVDDFGNVQLPPSVDLSVRGGAVPRPTERPPVVTAQEQLTGAAPGSFRAAQQQGIDQTFAEQTAREVISPTPAQGGFTQTAAERTQQRVDTRPAAVREAMAFTIAGELGQQTLSDLASGDPERVSRAREEIAAIASTIDNRAQSPQYANAPNPFSEVLSPNAYNSLMSQPLKPGAPAPIETTQRNYEQFGQLINQALVDYDYGVLQSPVPDATHYASLAINPGWEKYALGGMTPVGQHKFGTIAMKDTSIPEFRPSGEGFGRIAGGGTSSINLVNTTSPSGFGDFTRFSGASNNAPSGFSNYGAGSTLGQSSAGVTSENVSGGFESQFSGSNSFGGFSAGSLGGSASGTGSGLGSAGSGGYSSFSSGASNNPPSYSSGASNNAPSYSGGGPGYGSSGDYTSSSSSSRSSSSRSSGGFSGTSSTYGGTPSGGSGVSPSGPGGALSGI